MYASTLYITSPWSSRAVCDQWIIILIVMRTYISSAGEPKQVRVFPPVVSLLLPSLSGQAERTEERPFAAGAMADGIY